MITQQDLDDYGPEFVNFSRRAAADALQPALAQLRAENQQLRQLAQRSQNSTIQAALDQAIPDWRTTYADPAFSDWLQSPDPYAAETRSALLRRAVAAGDAHRVVRFYQGFMQEAGHHAPARQHASRPRWGASGGNIYTRSQIADLYKRRRDGLIGDAAWARQEADIFAAGREGRVVGALNLTDGTALSRLA
jgi:hypothetical protein